MASAREELISNLVDNYDIEEERAIEAVARYINEHAEDAIGDLEEVAEHIYTNQRYWE